ncbi:sulfatase-like hydrolase/transferase [Nonomuraea angiospora]|uniref:sulfatase-like hydrolase/transferase n=1 Tax=Nonomuraea angiospora TaxID=46172 RepID=UPI00331CF5DC
MISLPNDTAAAQIVRNNLEDAPNVLLIVADQHRYDWIEGTGDLPVRTPHLRRLAERGMTFRRAVTPAPLCAPARACLATGLDYDSGPVPSNFHDLPPETRTYFRTLRDEAGYHVAGVGKFDLHKATFDWNLDGSRCLREWGLDGGIDNEGKFDSLWSGRTGPKGPYMNHLYGRGVADLHLRDFERRRHEPYFDVEPSPLPEDAYLDNWIARNARDVLSNCPQGRPWHVVVNFAGPHDPMDVPPGLIDRWRDVEFPVPAGEDPAGTRAVDDRAVAAARRARGDARAPRPCRVRARPVRPRDRARPASLRGQPVGGPAPLACRLHQDAQARGERRPARAGPVRPGVRSVRDHGPGRFGTGDGARAAGLPRR